MRVAVAVLAASILLSCGKADERPIAAEKPKVPVFIVSIDTLRSDRLSIYGDGGAKTPAFERLRKDAILFEHAFTQTPLTLPAHASLFTGRLPSEHRVRDNAGYRISAQMPTLPSTLRAAGYATGAAVSSYVLRRDTGIGAGFDFFDDTMPGGSEERPGGGSRNVLTRWIESTAARPLFGFLHLFEPHSPYTPPPAFSRARTPYDGEVSAADTVLGAFLDDLERTNLYRDSLIIVLSDHGEGLGDHGEDEHGVFLYREVIQVPLLVKLPGNARAGQTISRAVALIDVFPTVLEIAGIAAPGQLDGQSLLSSEPPGPIYSETFFPRLHLGWSESFSLLDESVHFIDAPRDELYRYRTDLEEKTNIIEEERRAAAAMRETLAQVDRTLNPPGNISEEERRSLAALGYLGSGAAASGSLPDAKDRIHTLRDLRRAYEAWRQHDARTAASILRRLIDEAPELIDAWTILADCQVQLMNTRGAIATLQSAAARFPARPEVQARLAQLLVDTRQFAAAQQAIDKALALSPDQPPRGVHYARSVVLLEQRRVGEAEQALRREVELHPAHLEAWGALAAVIAGQGRLPEAESVLREAERRNPGDAMRHIARDTLRAASQAGR
jgi:tetratricopeptide (TPR) repeat protein